MQKNNIVIFFIVFLFLLIVFVALTQVQRVENTKRMNSLDGFDRCIFICTKFVWNPFAKPVCLEKCENHYTKGAGLP
jgi:hypothetical protein